ncbi:MAG: hypothetical protein ACREBS_00600 [Nitrososphaerales archaeon]
MGLSKSLTPTSGPTVDGLLLVSAEANLTVIPGNPVGSLRLGQGGFADSPLAGVLVSISDSSSSSMSMFSNFTSSSGKLSLYLAPATYKISFLDWRLNYSAVTVQIVSAQITHVSVYLNATTYPVLSFNVVDPDSTGYAVQWEKVFAQVPGQQSAIAENSNTYLEIANLSPTAYMGTAVPSVAVPVSVAENMKSQTSQWLQLQVSTPLNIGAIQNVRILSLNALYLVSVGA